MISFKNFILGIKNIFKDRYFIDNTEISELGFNKSDYKIQYQTKRNCIKASVDVYKSYTREEVEKIHPALVTFWRIGKRTYNYISGYGTNYAEIYIDNRDRDTSTKEIGSHYKFSYKGIKLDPYRILEVYNITNPCQQHAIKKLLRAGNSIKDLLQDIEEVIASLERWKEMIKEDGLQK